MFITSKRHRGPFILLLQKEDSRDIYACIRRVSLSQLGNFMMGSANINGKWETVSGSYGNDGLPMTVKALPKDAVKLPQGLYDAWNHGGGWNSSGTEGPAMKAWALETFRP